MSHNQEPQRWLLLIYRVPQDPPGRRTYVWRQLKNLGAIYLQQAAVIMPDRPPVRSALEELARRIREFEGEVSLLETTSPDRQWEQELIDRFNQARNREYAEIVENVERFQEEVRRETAKSKFTYTELEDVESDWEKLHRWRERILARDFFGASGQGEAAQALESGQASLAGFTARVYANEGVQEDDPEHETSKWRD